MTTKLKKLLTSLLAFSLVLGMLPMGTMASAAANINNGDITVWEYHVPYSNVPALEAYARASTTTDMGNRHITQIYVHFTDGSEIPLVRIAGTWSGTISSDRGHQPSDVDSIQLGFWKFGYIYTAFVSIPAEQLDFANYKSTMNFTEISLAAEIPTPPIGDRSLSVSYVFPDNEKPDGEFIDYVDQLKAGDAFTVEEIDAPGYIRTVTVDGAETEVIDGALSGTMPEGDVTVTFTYTPIPESKTYDFSVSYVFDGKKPDGGFKDYVEHLKAGAPFAAVEIAAPEGYTCTVAVDGVGAETSTTIAGTMPANDVTVTFTYTPNSVVEPETEYLTFEYVKPGMDNVSDAPPDITSPSRVEVAPSSYTYNYENVGSHSGSVTIPNGYFFNGWFSNRGCTEEVSENTVVSAAATFYGYWTKTEERPVEPPVTPPSPSYSYYRATVRYLALDTNAVLADAYSTDTIREGRSYDVSAQAALAISGYTIDHVEGATSGTLNGNVTVTVWYSAETVLENPDVPLVDVPEVPPTTPPAPDVSGESGEVILVDPETPLGDLPQTGIVAEAADPANTLGFAALAASMAMAGLAVTLNRKREDAE